MAALYCLRDKRKILVFLLLGLVNFALLNHHELQFLEQLLREAWKVDYYQSDPVTTTLCSSIKPPRPRHPHAGAPFPNGTHTPLLGTAPTRPSSSYVVWTYPAAPNINATTRLDDMVVADDEIFLCAYRAACPATVPWERINLRELTRGTPCHDAVMNHALQKVIHGRDYPDHVQSVALLALVYKHPHACVRSWGDARQFCLQDLRDNFSHYYPPPPQQQQPNASSSSPAAVVVPLVVPVSRPDLSSLRFLTLKYPNGRRGNSGDEIQDLTGVQFQPFISGFVHRDHGWRNVNVSGNVINNAWYGNNFNYPQDLQQRVNMTLLSIHYSGAGRVFANRTHNLRVLREYTQRVGPIGARDSQTLDFLQQQLHLPAYLSRCLTLMLQLGCHCHGCPPCREKRDYYILNDVEPDLLPERARQQLRGAPVREVTANMMFERNDETFPKTYEYAFRLLTLYATRAKLVITSRLHSALPAFAMGVPVIFVNNPKRLPGGDRSRLSGIFDLFTVYQPGDEWTFDLEQPPPNPGVHLADRNRASFWNYLKRRSTFYEDSARLHGMIPLQRLGRDRPFPELHSTFHFVVEVQSERELLSWQIVRAIEYVFYHHPNAHVTVHYSEDHHLPPPLSSKLDIFPETGYHLSVEAYNLACLIGEVARGARNELEPSLVRGFLADAAERADSDATWHTREKVLVGLLVLLRDGGVLLGSDVYVLKGIPVQLQNAISNGSGGAATGPSIMILQQGHDAGLAMLQWVLKNYKKKQPQLTSSSSRLLVESALWNSDASQSIRTFPAGEFYSLLGDDARSCFTTKLDLDISDAYAVHIDAEVSKDYDLMSSGSTCDDLLYRHCILCDELHTKLDVSDSQKKEQ